MRDKRIIYPVMIILVPIAGEFKFMPFEGDLRVSLGTPVFLFLLLWSKRMNSIKAGFYVATSVVVFRIMLSIIIQSDLTCFDEAFRYHFPVFFYYLTYGFLFRLFKVNDFHHSPFVIGWLGVIIEFLSSIAELNFRYIFSSHVISLKELILIVVIAIFRNFFVLGFFDILILRDAKIAEEEQKQRNKQLLMLVSNIYVEMIQLKNSMNNAEELTRDCYEMYRTLKEHIRYGEVAGKALRIAGKVHEIKKDNQRIHAGLSKLMTKMNSTDYMEIKELIHVIVTSNMNYSEILGKLIHFHVDIQGEHPPYRTLVLLSIINNLVSNAVEAIKEEGDITISINRNPDQLKIRVSDNGPGIPEKNRDLLFQPGFTTKFDAEGNMSNGIGLTHVKKVIEDLNGNITLENPDPSSGNTTFRIVLPLDGIIMGESEYS
ncbi:sensor histidine kinase [Thermoactinomyces mirandus]|uniref:histidine kinase n=1 Tax=Thermoactinomyces mirandus TaxID=2756294 RepID=A0A7W2ARH5_9BACL|nr:sensor histidine kinase [Thermoactinomyces mirandus]MBA4602362.1 sensor histidine kinase [Thermoactinomyces mirandus]